IPVRAREADASRAGRSGCFGHVRYLVPDMSRGDGRGLLLEPVRADPLGTHADGDPPLLRRAPGVLVLAQVLLRQPVDLRVGSLGGELRLPVDRDPAVRIARVDDGEREARVPLEV